MKRFTLSSGVTEDGQPDYSWLTRDLDPNQYVEKLSEADIRQWVNVAAEFAAGQWREVIVDHVAALEYPRYVGSVRVETPAEAAEIMMVDYAADIEADKDSAYRYLTQWLESAAR